MLNACLALIALAPSTDVSKYLDVALARFQKGPVTIDYTGPGDTVCQFMRSASGQRLTVRRFAESFEYRANSKALIEIDHLRKEYYYTEQVAPFEVPLGEVTEYLPFTYPQALDLKTMTGYFGQMKSSVVATETGTTLSGVLQAVEGTITVTFKFDANKQPISYKLVNPARGVNLHFEFSKAVWTADESVLTPEIPTGYSPIYLPDPLYPIATDAPWPEMRLMTASSSTPTLLSSHLKSRPSLLFFGRYDEVINVQVELEKKVREQAKKYGERLNFVSISMTAEPGSADFVATPYEQRRLEVYGAPMVVLLGPKREVLQMWQGSADDLPKALETHVPAKAK